MYCVDKLRRLFEGSKNASKKQINRHLLNPGNWNLWIKT